MKGGSFFILSYFFLRQEKKKGNLGMKKLINGSLNKKFEILTIASVLKPARLSKGHATLENDYQLPAPHVLPPPNQLRR